ncbi:MAG: hypothetical protein PHX13_01460 [Thiovulaceae bacterium]|nr:hypothetical protein [Sulfurimonadaceae bacterium]
MISLDYKGFYWAQFDENKKPINPKECQIIFNPKDGGELKILLNLDEEYDEVKYNKFIDKLFGISKESQTKGKKSFTLLNLKLIEPPLWQINSGLELTELRYSIEYILYGGWVEFENSIEIMHVRYSYFELWFNQLEIKRPHNDENKTFPGVVVNKEHLKGSDTEYKVLFDIHNGFNQSSFNNKVITCEATNSLAIKKKEDFNIEEAISLSLVVRNFFEIITFYSKNKIFIEELKVYQNNEDVIILFKQDDYMEEQQMSHLDFLFRYDDVKENFVAILNNWIENHDKNQNEYQAFCNVIADKNTRFNIYSHYFQLISVLEAYHRLQHKDIEEQEEQKHKNYLDGLKTQLTEYLSSDEKKKILYKLKYQYGTNFKERLKDLIEVSKVKEVIVCEESIHNKIMEFIYKMRNHLAHLKNEIELNQQLKSSFEYLKLVALLIMLKDISLNHAQISKNIFDMDISYVQRKLVDAFSDSQIEDSL